MPADLRRSLFCLTASALLALFTSPPARAEGLRIEVRGSSHFEVRTTRDALELVLQGVLKDDLGEGIPNESFVVRVSREGRPSDGETQSALGLARSCAASAVVPLADVQGSTQRGEGAALLARTDSGGRFCLRARLPIDRYAARLEWMGSGFLDATTAQLTFDLGRKPVVLGFDPRPRVIPLDRTPARLFVLAESDENGATQPAPKIRLDLVDERGQALGSATTDAQGRGHIDVNTATLGAPGRGELRLSFVGDADAAPASASVEIERHARVTLRAPRLESGAEAAAAPEEGIPILVLATTVAGPVSDGVVEARVGDVVVGAARVEAGRANLIVTFGGGGANRSAELRIRYLPATPWLEPGPDLVVQLPTRAATPWSRVPFAVAGLFVIAWLALSRARPGPAGAPDPRAERGPMDHAAIELVSSSGSERGVYRGVVEDAHDGFPLPDVTLLALRPSFSGRAVLARATTDARGLFSFEVPERHPGDLLVLEGPYHSALERELSAPGELRAALVMRKRKVLERLVRWAKRRGAPYDGRPEPTPGHVVKVAREETVAAWAEAVERAVYAGSAVDKGIEASIEALAPGDKEGAEARLGSEDRPKL